ncbi:pseudouridine synthase [Virgibacillus sp. W0430]|uniref:pseudouridine synthase n=1 Tax=Virgibacillus sp. W0430 TaxID=3391580 RepID=UPI003F48BFDF
MRLDKLLANMGFGSRKDVKQILKKQRVSVDSIVIKDGSYKVDPYIQHIEVDKTPVYYQKYIYLMMNKSAGCISATEDRREQTVIDLLPDKWKKFNPFPVGRLDKDTEGLLLLTNDGDVAHQLTAPKKNIEKTYYATIDGEVTESNVLHFARGVELEDGYLTKPALLNILMSGPNSEVELTITEGKFHQVKRMFEAIHMKVTYLKRIRMGQIILDNQLTPGSVRTLTDQELKYINLLKPNS